MALKPTASLWSHGHWQARRWNFGWAAIAAAMAAAVVAAVVAAMAAAVVAAMAAAVAAVAVAVAVMGGGLDRRHCRCTCPPVPV